ncbi:uncharacterized protein LOC128674173 isoform X2 [Plodia interpunctella]|uniref:uncharacterized protein LOC128674173 isoform X2 n=1 Tax=Plodia interpunctella TaxID=58824 RepID=UPI002368E801|nr:uncharacterized protein LOC128674173 isoform X2 [Plodia interpunctella]
MRPSVAHTAALLLLAGTMSVDAQNRDRGHSLDLIRLLTERPWPTHGYNRWDRSPRVDASLDPGDLDPHYAHLNLDDDDNFRNFAENEYRVGEKRSAVATVLNSGRRRRQPTPALGKAVTPYVGVGVLNDVGSFFDSLRDNLETLASLSPQQRGALFQDVPTVVHAPSSGGGGGGTGMRRLHALRPLRPSGIRSFVEADGGYPGANHHDPGLLWTGLGR